MLKVGGGLFCGKVGGIYVLGGGIDLGGHRHLDCQKRVDALAEQWMVEVWGPRASKALEEDFVGMFNPDLPRPSAAEVKGAALRFPECTGIGADQWHPRHFAYLPDALVEGWIAIMIKAEDCGWLPAAMELLTVVFIPKGVDGVRPIGLCTASQILWGKVRRRVADDWP